MKKRDLKKLALLGLTGGMLMAAQGLQAGSDQGKIFRSGGHSCGGGSCGGGTVYQGSYPASHGCGGGNGNVVYPGSHGCGGGNGNVVYPGSHGCGGGNGNVMYPGNHGCGGGNGNVVYPGNYRGSHGCGGGNGPVMNPSQGQPVNPQSQKVQNNNRSMPQFENQPKYQQQESPSVRTAPNNKPTAYLDQPVRSGRFIASNDVTEQNLSDQLNPESKEIYKSLSPEGKKLAVKLANQDCKGKNDCKGQNSCKNAGNAGNDCAGKGGCKGTSPGPFTDKNQAVKVAKMQEKRQAALRGY